MVRSEEAVKLQGKRLQKLVELVNQQWKIEDLEKNGFYSDAKRQTEVYKFMREDLARMGGYVAS